MHERELGIGIALVMLISGLIIGALGYKERMQKEAIKAGVAYYDPKTAEFKWIDVNK
jgi:hypothetical protein